MRASVRNLSLCAAALLSTEGSSVVSEVLQHSKRKHHKKHHHKKNEDASSFSQDTSSLSQSKAVVEQEEPKHVAAEKKVASPTRAAEKMKVEAKKVEVAKKAEMELARVKHQQPAEGSGSAPSTDVASAEEAIMDKMKALENKLETVDEHHVANHVMMTGKLDVNGPLPADFNALFAQSVAKAAEVKNLNCPANEIKVLETNILQTFFIQSSAKANVIVEIVFQGPANCVHEAQKQAAAADSPLVADTPMYAFLVAKGETAADVNAPPKKDDVGVDIDTEMPYGELEPFGREDTAQELTEDSIKESDGMVDQIERAQVAEEKRSVFRALTRLRGAAITSFDGVARSQTGNIDEYNKTHKWRKTHPLHHLAAEEADVTKWAFPASSD